MRNLFSVFRSSLVCSLILLLAACTNMSTGKHVQIGQQATTAPQFADDYASRLPQQLDTEGKKMVLVDPNVHAWGAYGPDGHLIRAGIATAGGSVCPPDSDEPDCRTSIGTFHITSLGDDSCFSSIYPKPHGGGLMPYCMHFHDGQALHGSPDTIVTENNESHGCVRMRIPDAEWMRYSFAQVGTKVVVRPYN
jgi:hypothetical protein